ncbi:hypothetical protein ER308_15210 [Egibacter rhizosphaerae]|uniref:Fic/DOC N-terminal domain-containing protein n=1 Tax=Egibacter rhizosphaerae TaxID=1670831 RepID=A0A411YI31_9ACTN|nr:hypothetical protein ER308_15210 [Egibacter rhizosphaerae]
MDRTRFVSNRFGRLEQGLGPYDLLSFHPEPLPRTLDLDSSLVNMLSSADRALGRLAGVGRLLPNPHLLVTPYVTREALASSRIEGTQASLSDVFSAAIGGAEAGADTDEVRNYVHAMEYGLERLATLPISVRFMEELHGELMSGVRGQERQPGEVRSSPNWIGSPDNRPETAVFVPVLRPAPRGEGARRHRRVAGLLHHRGESQAIDAVERGERLVDLRYADDLCRVSPPSGLFLRARGEAAPIRVARPVAASAARSASESAQGRAASR